MIWGVLERERESERRESTGCVPFKGVSCKMSPNLEGNIVFFFKRGMGEKEKKTGVVVLFCN